MPPHVDPDDLALLALGEHVDGVEARHLSGCAQCQSHFDQLRAVVTVARTGTLEDSPQAPPPQVWDRISAEIGLDTGAGSREVTALPRRADRRTTWAVAAAAAVAGIALGAGATAALSGSGGEGSDGRGRVVSSAQLAALPDHTGTGDAEILGRGSSRVLELDVSGLTRGDGFYQVWLLGADARTLVSVGLLDTSKGTRATFPLPAALELAEFPIVDVSLEPVDGNPAHSGDSVVRGTLAG